MWQHSVKEVSFISQKLDSKCNSFLRAATHLDVLLFFSPPGVDFTNILCAAFTRADLESTKDTDDLTVFLYFCDLQV